MPITRDYHHPDLLKGIVNDYYPPEQFTGDLDIPFEAWSNSLQSAPSPTANRQVSTGYDLKDQPAFQPDGDLSTFTAADPMTNQQWSGMWPQSQIPDMQSSGYDPSFGANLPTAPETASWNSGYNTQSAQSDPSGQPLQQPYIGQQGTSAQTQPWTFGTSASNTSPASETTLEERRRQNNELNFGMGIYQPIPRRR